MGVAEGAWFVKRPENIGKEQRRFFVVDDAAKAIQYFERLVGGTPTHIKGTIPLGELKTAEARGKTLLLATGKRKYKLLANDAAQAKAWSAALTQRMAGTPPEPHAPATAEDSEAAVAPSPAARAEPDTHTPPPAGEGDAVPAPAAAASVGNALPAQNGAPPLAAVQPPAQQEEEAAAETPNAAGGEDTTGTAETAAAEDMIAPTPEDAGLIQIENPLYDARHHPEAATEEGTPPPAAAAFATTATADDDESPASPNSGVSVPAAQQASPLPRANAPAASAATTTQTTASDAALEPLRAGAWFVKRPERIGKGQRRYFALVGVSQLEYFAKVGDDGPHDSRGSIALGPLVEAFHDGRDLYIRAGARTYHLVSEDEGTVATWAGLLQRAIARTDPALPLVEQDVSGGQAVPTVAPRQLFLGDWFLWRADRFGGGDQRRFLLLHGRSLSLFGAYDGHRATDRKEEAVLFPSMDVYQDGADLYTKTGKRTWHLSAADSDMAARWVALLRAAAASSAPVTPLPVTAQVASHLCRIQGSRTSDTYVMLRQGSVLLYETADEDCLPAAAEEIPLARLETTLAEGAASITLCAAGTPGGAPGPAWELHGAAVQELASKLKMLGRCPPSQHGGDDAEGGAARATPPASSPPRPPSADAPAPGAEPSASLPPPPPPPASRVPSFDDGVWLVKRAEVFGKEQRRFFVRLGQELQYFSEYNENTEPVLKGAVRLGPLTEVAVDGRTLRINNPDRSWELGADEDAAALALAGELRAATSKSAAATRGNAGRIAFGPPRPGSGRDPSEGAPLPGTWFRKKADVVGRDQQRYFVLHSSGIDYFEDVLNGVPVNKKGNIPIGAGTVATADDLVLAVGAAGGRDWRLTGNTVSDVVTWAEAITAAADRLDDQTAAESAAAAECAVVPAGTEDHSGSQATTGGAPLSEGGQPAAAAASPEAGVGGGAWFVKRADKMGKNQRRFFTLEGRELRYFARCVDGVPQQQKGAIALGADVLPFVQDRALCVKTPKRTYELEAESGVEAQRWCKALRAVCMRHGAAGGEAGAAGGPDGQVPAFPRCDEQAVRRGAWFRKAPEKRGSAQRRYFVWEGRRVAYYADMGEGGTPANERGEICLSADTQVDRLDDELVIINVDRTWHLTPDNHSDVAVWHDTLHKICYGLRLREHEADLAADRSAARLGGDAGGGTAPDGAGAELSGWFLRRGDGIGGKDRQRFFVFAGGRLACYADSQEAGPVGLKGDLVLSAADVASADDREVTVKSAGKAWRFVATTSEEARKWAKVVARHCAGLADELKRQREAALAAAADGVGVGEGAGGSQATAGGETAAAATPASPTDGGEGEGPPGSPFEVIELDTVLADGESPLPGAWFTKRAERLGKDKTRYFVLQGGKIEYFADEKDGVPKHPKGAIDLATVTKYGLSDDSRSLLLHTPGRLWHLTESTHDAARRWHTRLTATAAGAQAGPGPGAPRVPGHGAVRDAAALRAQLAEAVAPAWFVKKAEHLGKDQRRLFVLTGSAVEYYAGEDDTGAPADHKGSVELAAGLDALNDDEVLLLHAAGRTWHLAAESKAVAVAWADAIRRIVAVAATASGDPLGRYQLTAWFVKKAESVGKDHSRFFTLEGHTVAYFAGLEDGAPARQKGEITIDPTTHVSNLGRVLEIRTRERGWVLTADTEDQAELWASQLSELCQGGVGGENEVQLLPGRGVWLVKESHGVGESKRRFFTLVRGERSHWLKFNYYKAFRSGIPVDKKGGIRLVPASRITTDHDVLVVENDDRKWTLRAEDEATAKLWCGLLLKRASEANAAEHDASLVSTEAVAKRQEEERHGTQPLKGAWMTKRGLLPEDDRRRFILLQGEVLQCFTDQPRRTQRLKPESSLPLVANALCTTDRRSLTLTTTKRSWHLQTDSQALATEWAQHLTRLCVGIAPPSPPAVAVDMGSAAGESRTDHDALGPPDAVSEAGAAAPAQAPFSGSWLHGLSKEGRCARRYFEISEARDFVQYYDGLDADDQPVDLEGSFAVDDSVTFFQDACQFTIITPNRTYQLEADSAPLAEQWAHALKVGTGVLVEDAEAEGGGALEPDEAGASPSADELDQGEVVALPTPDAVADARVRVVEIDSDDEGEGKRRGRCCCVVM